MHWALALLLAFLLPAIRIASNLEGRMMSITRKTGSAYAITCDIQLGTNYIHWYLFQESRAPRHFLYYDFLNSKKMVQSGISPGKYNTVKATDKRFKLILTKLEASDSGVYYCATWDRHSDSVLPCATTKTLLLLV
uniref:Ig-like domain-containing protein n=1 Tax=Otolemur garnettii TaxID=30611 RepID=H0X1J5_OTOGA